MNKYSLKFLNHKLEDDYQKEFLLGQYKLFLTILILSVIQFILRLISEILIDFSIQSILLASIIVILIITGIITYKWRRFTSHALNLISVLLMVLKFGNHINESQISVLIAENLMITLSFTLICMDFKDGIILNVFALISRIIYTYYLMDDTLRNFQQYSFIFFVFILISISLYQKSKYMRYLFLKSLQDNIYEKCLLTMAKRPIFTFTYDTDKLAFITKTLNLNGFLGDIQDPLHYFLRESMVETESLENFIYYNHILHKTCTQELQIQSLKVIFKKQRLNITFTHFHLEKVTFILEVDSENLEIKQQEKEYVRKLNQLRQKVAKLLFISIKIIHLSEIKGGTPNVIMQVLKSKYLWMLCNLKYINIKPKTINLVNFAKEIRNSFNKNTIIVRANQKIQIKIIKLYLWIFLNEIFSMQQHNLLLTLNIDIYQGKKRITIMGLQQLPSSKEFEQICSYLMQYRQSHGVGITLLSMIVHIFYFNDEPMVSYMQ